MAGGAGLAKTVQNYNSLLKVRASQGGNTNSWGLIETKNYISVISRAAPKADVKANVETVGEVASKVKIKKDGISTKSPRALRQSPARTNSKE